GADGGQRVAGELAVDGDQAVPAGQLGELVQAGAVTHGGLGPCRQGSLPTAYWRRGGKASRPRDRDFRPGRPFPFAGRQNPSCDSPRGPYPEATVSDTATFQDLITRVRAGDRDAAAEFVRRYQPLLRRTVHVRLRDQRLRRVVDSMDVCQSVLGS